MLDNNFPNYQAREKAVRLGKVDKVFKITLTDEAAENVFGTGNCLYMSSEGLSLIDPTVTVSWDVLDTAEERNKATFYHYTSPDGDKGISELEYIRATTTNGRDMMMGPGVYMTKFQPESKLEICSSVTVSSP